MLLIRDRVSVLMLVYNKQTLNHIAKQ